MTSARPPAGGGPPRVRPRPACGRGRRDGRPRAHVPPAVAAVGLDDHRPPTMRVARRCAPRPPTSTATTRCSPRGSAAVPGRDRRPRGAGVARADLTASEAEPLAGDPDPFRRRRTRPRYSATATRHDRPTGTGELARLFSRPAPQAPRRRATATPRRLAVRRRSTHAAGDAPPDGEPGEVTAPPGDRRRRLVLSSTSRAR